MTAFVGLVSNDTAIIGTDTLTRYPPRPGDTQLRPRSYSSKTFLLPQFKSAFATTGIMQVGLCFFNLVVESAYGIDIDSLVNIDLKHFQKKLESDYEQFISDMRGTIYLFGYSHALQRFKGFKLLVNLKNTLNWQEFPSECFILKPIVNDWENKISEAERVDYCELIADLMKIQKEEDEQKEIANQVGIGGQVLCTHLSVSEQTGNLIVISKIVHQFEDFIKIGNEMIRNSDG